MIMEKIIKIIIFILFCQNGFAFANVNESALIEKGRAFLQKAVDNKTPELNPIYINKAKYFYYIASQNVPPSSEALIGLGRVYMLQNKYDEAKDAFFKAYSVDPYNANSSFYFGEFWFKYRDYINALKYYEQAQKLGFEDSAKNIEMINICKSKLGVEKE